MAVKLTSRQQAQLAYLEGLGPRFQKIQSTIELMADLKADEAAVRSMGRALDEIKAGAGQLSLNSLADTAGLMSTISRRGGGLQFRIRGLKELFGSLKLNYDAAMKSATTPGEESASEEKQ
jgi:hypothetical protein